MAYLWSDNFASYGAAIVPGVWTGSLPALTAGGRGGSPRARWNKGSMVRAGGGQTVTVGGVYIVEDSQVLIPHKGQVGAPGETLSTGAWLMGVSWNGWAYMGLVATNDGALHIMQNGAFEGGPNTQLFEFVASSAPGVISPRGWHLIETTFVSALSGSVRCYVNGREVVNFFGYTKQLLDYCQYVLHTPPCPELSPLLWPNESTEIVIGAGTRGGRLGGSQGWTGYMDSVWAFNDDTIRGDLLVDTLLPIGAGALSQSAIGGTTPAATRWQSVDDALTPDNEVTTVVYDLDRPKTDEYTVTALNRPGATIYGAYAHAIARRAQFGSAQLRFGLSDGFDVVSSGLAKIRTSAFRSYGMPFNTNPAGDAWAATDLDALRLRVTRAT